MFRAACQIYLFDKDIVAFRLFSVYGAENFGFSFLYLLPETKLNRFGRGGVLVQAAVNAVLAVEIYAAKVFAARKLT